jgi:3-hydroxyacyl-CoA dehydrogenase
LESKQALLSRLAPHFPKTAVVSTNTSGIPIAAIAAGLPTRFRHAGWAHFFNPPRYLRLLELIPTPLTDLAVVERVSDFADRRLRKGIVIAKDTPGFIANRLGIFGALRSIELVESGEFTIEEVDAMTGPVIGRPKSATFRTMDIAGVDILTRVAADLEARLGGTGNPGRYSVPRLLTAMLDRGLAGAKSGQGFYKRATPDPGSPILVLDPSTLEYARRTQKLPALEAAANISDPATACGALSGQIESAISRRTLGATIAYAQEIAPTSHTVRRHRPAMRLGFGWDLGPFEIEIGNRLPRQTPSPVWSRSRHPREIQRRGPSNAGASLVDLATVPLRGVSFQTQYARRRRHRYVERRPRRRGKSQALVVANDADNSAGAVADADSARGTGRQLGRDRCHGPPFQGATMASRRGDTCGRRAGRAGVGWRLRSVPARRPQTAAAETYMGFEVGVGLLPQAAARRKCCCARSIAPAWRILFRSSSRHSNDRLGKVSARLWMPRVSPTCGFRRRDDESRSRAGGCEAMRSPCGRWLLARLLEPCIRWRTDVMRPALGIHLAHRSGRVTDHETIIGRKVSRARGRRRAASHGHQRAGTARSRTRGVLESLASERHWNAWQC